jgi:hypothetical protein
VVGSLAHRIGVHIDPGPQLGEVMDAASLAVARRVAAGPGMSRHRTAGEA